MFGGFVKNKRIEIGLTLRSFCRSLNEDPSNWSKVERGVLNPPQDKEKLNQIAHLLKIKKASDEYQKLFDYSSIDAGKIPEDIMTNKDMLGMLPLFFRTIGSVKPTKEDVQEFIESLKKEYKDNE